MIDCVEDERDIMVNNVFDFHVKLAVSQIFSINFFEQPKYIIV